MMKPHRHFGLLLGFLPMDAMVMACDVISVDVGGLGAQDTGVNHVMYPPRWDIPRQACPIQQYYFVE